MSASEVLYGTPGWEVDLLVAGLEAEFTPAPVNDDPGSPAPGRYSLTIEED